MPAQNFALFTLNNNERKILFNEISLLPQNGLMLINFTSHTCRPCRIEIPELEGIAGKYRGKVKVWIIYIDSDVKKVSESAAEIGIKNPVFVDLLQTVSRDKYRVEKIPTTFVLDRNKNIKAVITGYTSENMSRLSEYIKNN